jgi:hypothetical protein
MGASYRAVTAMNSVRRRFRPDAAAFPRPARQPGAAAEIGRVEIFPLRLARRPCDGTVADLMLVQQNGRAGATARRRAG